MTLGGGQYSGSTRGRWRWPDKRLRRYSMAFTLTMPEVGETVTEGTIERWLKKPGDKVEKYEPIVEINTDKVNVELPCPVSGTLTEILAQEGATIPVGAELARLETAAGEVPADISPVPTDEEASAASAAQKAAG